MSLTMETLRPIPHGPSTTSHGVDDRALLARVLKPYKPHCRYVQSAHVSLDDDQVVATCELAIPESCYIDDTGHFNSVEFNICYNQIVYFSIAKAVQERLSPAFEGWTLEEFWRRQLPDILITRFESCFRKPVNPRRFHGEVRLQKARARGASGLMLMRTTCRFWDDADGFCDGNVSLAFVGASGRLVS